MRLEITLLAIGVLALAPASASAKDTEGTAGAAWDGSHMRSRHVATYAERSGPRLDTSEVDGKRAPVETRTLEVAGDRPWETGPTTGNAARPTGSKKPAVFKPVSISSGKGKPGRNRSSGKSGRSR